MQDSFFVRLLQKCFNTSIVTSLPPVLVHGWLGLGNSIQPVKVNLRSFEAWPNPWWQSLLCLG